MNKNANFPTQPPHPDENAELGERMTWKCAPKRATRGSSFLGAPLRGSRNQLGGVGGTGAKRKLNLTYQVVTISGLDQYVYPTILEKENFYGPNVTTNEIGQIVKTLSYNNDGMKVQRTDFTYDDNNNLATQLTAFNPNMDVDIAPIQANIVSAITYPAYNYRNSLLQQTVDVNNDQTIDYHCYMQYDALNRLKAIYAAAGLAPTVDDATLLVSYAYDDANGLVDKKTHHIDDQGLAALVNEIDYSFDVRDRLTSIKAGLPTQAPMMNYQLYYDDQTPQYLDGPNVESVLASNNWNGNINGTQMEYALESGNIANPVLNYTKPLMYGYTYDKINRMTQADATVGDFLQGGSLNTESHAVGDESVRYDRIGNIKNMHRTLRNNDPTVGAPFSEVQHWNYSYDGSTNRLATVDGVNGTVSRAYLYDGNGNMLTDNSKNITGTEYGRSAYPFEMSKGETEISYLYSSNDLRIYKKSVLSNEETNEWAEDYYLMDALGKTVAILHRMQNDISGKWEYYASGSERESRLVPTAAQSPINNVNVGNASIAFGKDQASFYLYDHLGNTRITYTPTGFIAHPGDVSTSVNIINNVMDYFPYGKILREYVDGEQERYLTTQHERDTETDLDYRGARYYDNEVGRFLSLDPLAREYPSLSDYVYVADNPVLLIDPDGKTFIISNESQREQILGLLNTYSQHTYATNDKGVVYVKEWNTNENGSEYFSDRFQQAINSETITEIVIYEKERLPLPWTKDGWLTRGALPGMKEGLLEKGLNIKGDGYAKLANLGEGATFLGSSYGGAKNNLIYISGESSYTFYQDEQGNISEGGLASAAEILLHELVGHAIPAMIGTDTGNATKNENKVWEELHTTIRWVDPNHTE